MGSSRTRDWIRVPCIGRGILNHLATREVLRNFYISVGWVDNWMSIFFLQPIIEIISNKKDGRVERAGREGRVSLTRCHLTKDLIEVREKLGIWGKCLQAEGMECTKVFKNQRGGRWWGQGGDRDPVKSRVRTSAQICAVLRAGDTLGGSLCRGGRTLLMCHKDRPDC